MRIHHVVCLIGLSVSINNLVGAEDWAKYRRDLNNSGQSQENGIGLSNVNQLALKWSFNVGGVVSASPAVATINGTSMLFVGGWNGYFYALNAVTGQRIWSFQVDLVSPCSTNNCRIASSPSVTNGIVYFGAENAYLYALNAGTGALVWKQQLANPNNGYDIWSSPAVYNGTVYVGLASHDDSPCVVGQVVARNASTGAAVWAFSTIDQTTCSGGNCVGGGVWASPALDTTNGILYVGTGNPGSTCSPATANAGKYPDSILALKLSNGQLLNFYQAITNDNKDDDFGASPVLYTNTVYNECTLVRSSTSFVAEPNKNGSLYELQINNSGLLTSSATAINLDAYGFIASPGLAMTSSGSSCNPRQGKSIDYTSGQLWLASGNGSGGYLYRTAIPLGPGPAQLSISPPNAIYSAPSLIGDIAFFGSEDHHLYAVERDTAAIIWSYVVGGNINSAPSISNSRIYFGSDDGYVRCLSVNGQ